LSQITHWGAFLAEVQNGRFVGVRPFPRDPDPSPLIETMPAAVHSTTRIAQPMVREGFIARGRGNGEGRGRERFVPVSWERALDLVAGELDRVRRTHGHDAIMGARRVGRTPHTEALHLVERYRLVDYEVAKEGWERDVKENWRAQPPPNYRGKYLRLEFTVDDEGAFTTPSTATMTYGRDRGDWAEAVCAENIQWYSGMDAALPRADKPDF
jgi:hypothetical protein